uniref:Uncharacterized protein n=1 Tax=Cacopsylla melanoneura TaxID=428564 RepID=A0A8D8ZHW8_9HEMI
MNETTQLAIEGLPIEEDVSKKSKSKNHDDKRIAECKRYFPSSQTDIRAHFRLVPMYVDLENPSNRVYLVLNKKAPAEKPKKTPKPGKSQQARKPRKSPKPPKPLKPQMKPL